jgi:hypothetical protein
MGLGCTTGYASDVAQVGIKLDRKSGSEPGSIMRIAVARSKPVIAGTVQGPDSLMAFRTSELGGLGLGKLFDPVQNSLVDPLFQRTGL